MNLPSIENSALAQSFLELFGRLHPVAIHFPIALLLVAALVEFLRVRGDDRRPSATLLTCLSLGALGAIAAAGSGWVWAAQEPLGSSVERTEFLHRWIGVGTAGVATLSALLAWIARWSGGAGLATLYRAGLLLAAAGVSVGGYLGGELVWGEGHLTEVFEQETVKPPAPAPAPAPATESSATSPAPTALTESGAATAAAAESAAGATGAVEALTPADPTAAPAAQLPLTAATELTYASHVEPLLAAHCYECHGPRKKKAGLRLDGYARLFEDDPEYWVIAPGDPQASLLYERITLPPDDEDFMPKEGEPLSAEEVAVLGAWIAAGAKEADVFHLADAPRPAMPAGQPESASVGVPGGAQVPAQEVDLAIVSAPLVPSGAAPAALATEPPVVLGPDGEAALAALVARGAHAARLAVGSPLVEVDFSVAGQEVGDEDLRLLSGLEDNLVWLSLARTAVTDAGVQVLADFPRLTRLKLANTGLGDEALRAVAGLTALEVLNLYDTRVTDAGLAHLDGLTGLRKLYVWESGVTDAGAASLAEALPELTIVGDELAVLAAALAAEEAAKEWSVPCCDTASAEGETCQHPCCVAAAEKGELCATCRVEVVPAAPEEAGK